MLHCSLRASATPLPYMEQKGSASLRDPKYTNRSVASYSAQLFFGTLLSGAIVFLRRDSRNREDGDNVSPHTLYFGGSLNSSRRSVSKVFNT